MNEIPMMFRIKASGRLSRRKLARWEATLCKIIDESDNNRPQNQLKLELKREIRAIVEAQNPEDLSMLVQDPDYTMSWLCARLKDKKKEEIP
jgi:hypothetical protein